MTINIPQNTYQQPTECRENVVQLICNCFLQATQGCYSGDCVMPLTKEVWLYHYTLSPNSKDHYLSFEDNYSSYRYRDKAVIERYRLRTCEVNAAVQALRQAGYLIYRYYYRNYFCLVCSEKVLHPEIYNGYKEIELFNTNID